MCTLYTNLSSCFLLQFHHGASETVLPPQVVCGLLSLFPNKQYSHLLEWIYKLSRNTKTNYRVFILDVLSELIEQPLRTPGEGVGPIMFYPRCGYNYNRVIKYVLLQVQYIK